MTDFLEALLDLPQEEEETEMELRLPPEGRRPDTGSERVQTPGPGRTSEGTSLSAAPAQRTALTEAEAGAEAEAGTEAEAAVQPPVPLRGAAWARQAEETAAWTAQWRRADRLHKARNALGERRVGGYAGPLDRAMETARDALVRGTAFSLAQHPGGGQYAADAAHYDRVSSGEASAGGAAALERRLARSGARPTAVQRSDGEQVTVEAGPDLEELDRRVRRDARRYDGALTLY